MGLLFIRATSIIQGQLRLDPSSLLSTICLYCCLYLFSQYLLMQFCVTFDVDTTHGLL